MAKKRPKEKRRLPSAAEGAPPAAKATPSNGGGNPIGEFFASKGVRETIESVAIAFVLAFLFRTFEAEAFVIPTGSMADTLMGQHKDLECGQCGYRHTAGASEGTVASRGDIVGTVCPMCQFVNRFHPEDRSFLSHSGDRILVSKFIYDLKDPARWDVVVFKFPYNAKQNYIKRLVGLPGEVVRLQHGNVWVKPLGADDDQFVIARKSPGKLRAMLQEVHDTHYIPAALADERLWPRRWAQAEGGEHGWHRADAPHADDDRSLVRPTFTVAGQLPGQTHWLRYRHYLPRPANDDVPRPADWDLLQAGEAPVDPPAQLITDFYSYNASVHGHAGNWQRVEPDPPTFHGMHWVGDLAVECDVEVKGPQGKLLLDLVKAGRHYRCTVDVATGEAVLSIEDIHGERFAFNDAPYGPAPPEGGGWPMEVKGQTPIRGPGKHRLMLANVDNQVTLWVDDRVVPFDGTTAYVSDAHQPEWNDHDEGDLAPVGIGSDGASLSVGRLRVLRDIYYIADEYEPFRHAPFLNDYTVRGYSGERVRLGSAGSTLRAQDVRDVLANPRAARELDAAAFEGVAAPRPQSVPRHQWPHRELSPLEQLLASRRSVDFELQIDQYFTLGDNSPESQDARIWGNENFVHRDFLIGKAMFIYWPHPTGPIYGPNPLDRMRIRPLTPNFQRMRLVR